MSECGTSGTPVQTLEIPLFFEQYEVVAVSLAMMRFFEQTLLMEIMMEKGWCIMMWSAA
jgi:hypothetical protein